PAHSLHHSSIISRTSPLTRFTLFPYTTLFRSFLVGSAMAQPQRPKEEPAAPPAAWDNLVDEFFNSWFRFRPTNGTSAGLHQYDEQMEDYTRASLDAEVAALTDLEKRFAGLDLKNEPVGIGVDR